MLLFFCNISVVAFVLSRSRSRVLKCSTCRSATEACPPVLRWRQRFLRDCGLDSTSAEIGQSLLCSADPTDCSLKHRDILHQVSNWSICSTISLRARTHMRNFRPFFRLLAMESWSFPLFLVQLRRACADCSSSATTAKSFSVFSALADPHDFMQGYSFETRYLRSFW